MITSSVTWLSGKAKMCLESSIVKDPRCNVTAGEEKLHHWAECGFILEGLDWRR